MVCLVYYWKFWQTDISLFSAAEETLACFHFLIACFSIWHAYYFDIDIVWCMNIYTHKQTRMHMLTCVKSLYIQFLWKFNFSSQISCGLKLAYFSCAYFGQGKTLVISLHTGYTDVLGV